MSLNKKLMKTYNRFINEISGDDLKYKYVFCKYDRIVVRINNFDDRKEFFDIINKYDTHIHYDKRTYGIKRDYIILLKNFTLNNKLSILFTPNYNYFNSGDFIDDYPKTYPKLITPSEIDDTIKEIIGINNVMKLYEPKIKKIERTIECLLIKN